MTKSQIPVGVQLSKQWMIRRPAVYRYLEKDFVDAFFSDGTLRLSSFKRFKEHKDEARFDGSEGWGRVEVEDEAGSGSNIIAGAGQGASAYVLCGATRYSPEISQHFKTDSGFRINDTTAFACTIAERVIPGFRGGVEGFCHYVNDKVVSRRQGSFDFSKGTPTMTQLRKILGAAGDDLMFLKEARYASQNEYRLLWHVAGTPETHLTVKCPEALQFCTRFEDL